MKNTLSLLVSVAAISTSSVFAQSSSNDIGVDLTKSGAQIRTSDTVRLRNVAVTGHGNYWVDIQWQPAKMAFVPVNIGTESNPNFAVTSKQFSAQMHSTNPDYAKECALEFGSAYTQADWSDVKSTIGTSQVELQAFRNTTKMDSTNRFIATYGGSNLDFRNTPYYIQTNADQSGGDAVYDILLSSMAVRSTTFMFNANILCKKQ